MALPSTTVDLQLGDVLQHSHGVNDVTGLVLLDQSTPQTITGGLYIRGTVDPLSVIIDAIGNAVGSNFTGRRARGTIGTLTAVQTGDLLFAISGKGYGASTYSASSRASVRMTAAENWTNSAQGTNISFETTLIGAALTTLVANMRLALIANGIMS